MVITSVKVVQSVDQKKRFHRKHKLKQVFHKAGIRLTKQRLIIYRELISREDHPDVEHLYQSIKPKLPSISLFTVYRTMNRLENEYLIQRVATWKGHARYDGNIEEHAHFLCEQCGKLEDIVMKAECEGVLDHAKSCAGENEVHRVNILMTGTCEDCLAKESADSSD